MRLHGGRSGALGWRMSQAQGPVQARLPRPREEQALPKENPPPPHKPRHLLVRRRSLLVGWGEGQRVLRLWPPLAGSRGPGVTPYTLSWPQSLT